MLLIRPLGEHWQFFSVWSGDVLRYVNPPPSVSGEQQWLGHVETRWNPGARLRLTARAVGFLQDAFVDPSLSEGLQLRPVWVRLNGGYGALTARVSLPGSLTVEPTVQLRRVEYVRGYPGHYDEVRAGGRIEWKHSDALSISAAVFEAKRDYDELLQSTAGNRPLSGWLLWLRQRDAELRVTTGFIAAGEWSVTALVGRVQNRDEAFGFLDYDQDRARLQVRWARSRWSVSMTGDARRTDYRVQRVGSGRADLRPFRLTDGYDLHGRVERELDGKWTVFVDQRWERSRSNIVEAGERPFDYEASMVALGLERTF